MGAMSRGSMREKILEYLRNKLFASTRDISRKLGYDYWNTYKMLILLKDKGLVKDIRVKHNYPGSLSTFEVRYWFLVENEEEVLRWFEQNFHTSPQKKPKYSMSSYESEL